MSILLRFVIIGTGFRQWLRLRLNFHLLSCQHTEMPARCIAPLCKNSHPQFSMFRIPKVERFPKLHREWSKKILNAGEASGVQVREELLQRSSSRICELHFVPCDFLPEPVPVVVLLPPGAGQSRTQSQRTKRIRPTAVPSIFAKSHRNLLKQRQRQVSNNHA